MSDEPLNPNNDIAQWTTRARHELNTGHASAIPDRIDLTTGSPKWTPFAPAQQRAISTIKRDDIMPFYHSTAGTFSDATFPLYFESMGISKSPHIKPGFETLLDNLHNAINGLNDDQKTILSSALGKVYPVPAEAYYSKEYLGLLVMPLKKAGNALDAFLLICHNSLPKGHPLKNYTPRAYSLDLNKNFVPGNGATNLYAATVQSLLTDKDVLVVPVPTYGFFLEEKNLAGKRVKPLLLRPEDNFRLTPERLDSELKRINSELSLETPPRKASALLHINPHNPTGAVNAKDDVEKIAHVIQKHDLRLVIDDLAYAGLEYGHSEKGDKQRIAYPIAAAGGMFDKTITITSLSKAYSLVDLRAGMAAGPEEFITPLKEHIGRNQEFISSAGQNAFNAVAAPEFADKRKEYLAEHADFLKGAYESLRIMVNGWEQSEKSRQHFHNSPNEFFKKLTTYNPIIGHRFKQDPKVGEHRKGLLKKRKEIENSIELLDEAKPYLLDENKRETGVSLMHTVARQENFHTAQNMQMKMLPLMKDGIPGIKILDSVESGFFLLLDATALKGKYFGKTQINDSMELKHALSTFAGVELIAGEALGYYGDDIIMRLSFPKGITPELVEGLSRIQSFAKQLKDKPGPFPSITSNGASPPARD